MTKGRALHYVLKIAERKASINFFRDILGMKVLRHEEFREGCEATCNGPYSNRWSKTMIGYGPEDTHFVLELTYNYEVRSYELGNSLVGITIKSQESLQRAREAGLEPIVEKGQNVLLSPDGYKFIILNEPTPTNSDPIMKVTLASSNLAKTVEYWTRILDLEMFIEKDKRAVVGFPSDRFKLEFLDIGTAVENKTAFGRIAFSCPYNEQAAIDKTIQEHKKKILTPLVVLDTPDKASVRVIILADPDAHEICFVDDEGFRQLSKVDPDSDAALDKYIRLDKSRVPKE